MDRETQLWIAAAGDDFTGIVTQVNDGIDTTLKISLNGAVRASNGYVAYIMTSSIDCVDFISAEIDAHEMKFLEGRAANQYSIECILIIICAIIKKRCAVSITVSDNAVKEVLENVFCSRMFVSPSASIRCMSAESLRHVRIVA